MGERFEIPAGAGPGADFPRAAPGAYEVSGRTRRGFIFGARPLISFNSLLASSHAVSPPIFQPGRLPSTSKPKLVCDDFY